MNKPLATLSIALLFFSVSATASPLEDSARSLYQDRIKPLLSNDVVTKSITEQNVKHVSLSQTEVDTLDTTWRDEVELGGGDMTQKTLASDLSVYLQKVVNDAGGLFTEVFVMDNKGLNVGQSGLTSDFWQGDEAKWQETYQKGADAMHISEVEFDESTQTYQVQVSFAIVDPATAQVIGAATFAVDAEELE